MITDIVYSVEHEMFYIIFDDGITGCLEGSFWKYRFFRYLKETKTIVPFSYINMDLSETYSVLRQFDWEEWFNLE